MIGRGLIVAAVVLYAVVFGCVTWREPAETESPESLAAAVVPEYHAPAATPLTSQQQAEGLPFRSITLEIQRVDWIEKYENAIDQIARIGADTVMFVVDPRQENGSSSRIYLDTRMTPNPDQLADLIRRAKKDKLRVILMPIVLLDAPRQGSNEWRGTIQPEHWDEWFASYRDMLVNYYGWIAQGNGVDMMVVGSELVSSEDHVDQWIQTIQALRKVYKGRLTYSSNWDHYRSIQFWSYLDLIGMNSYWELGKNQDVSVGQIEAHWQNIQKDLLSWQREMGKPLMLLEVGWCSLRNAANEPWDYTKVSEPVDLDLQKKLYEAFFGSWYGNSSLGGFSIWEWTPDQGGPDDRGYTPQGKPAEQILRQWLAKSPWPVRMGK